MDVKTPKLLDLRGIILSMLSAVLGIILPRRYQITVIMHLEFCGILMLVQPTGSGKYIVMYGTETLIMSVTLVVILLIAIGVEQTICALRSKKILAFHLDKFCALDKSKMISFLGGLKKGKHRVILFASPQSLDHRKGWGAIVQTLILKGLLSMVAIYEKHCVPKCGTRSFRIEFTKLLENIPIYFKESPYLVALLAITGTLMGDLMTQFCELLKLTGAAGFGMTLWGDMAKRHIFLGLVVKATSMESLKKLLKRHIMVAGERRVVMLYKNEINMAVNSLI